MIRIINTIGIAIVWCVITLASTLQGFTWDSVDGWKLLVYYFIANFSWWFAFKWMMLIGIIAGVSFWLLTRLYSRRQQCH